MDSRMMDLFPYFFPVFFIGMWLTITTVLGFLSGWFRLQKLYPCGNEQPLLKLRSRTGSMGMGVEMSGILSLGACSSGLKVGIWKIFGPFQRPFLVPWRDIQATPARALFVPAVELSFGRPQMGRLKIDVRSWERLREAAASTIVPHLPAATPHVARRTTAKAMLLQWAVISLGAGCFFYFAPRLQGVQPGLPILVCFGFPAAFFGVAMLIRFLRMA